MQLTNVILSYISISIVLITCFSKTGIVNYSVRNQDNGAGCGGTQPLARHSREVGVRGLQDKFKSSHGNSVTTYLKMKKEIGM